MQLHAALFHLVWGLAVSDNSDKDKANQIWCRLGMIECRDLSFSEKGKRAYEKLNKGVKLIESKNGVYYLKKGEYIVKINDINTGFKIK